MRRQSKKHVAVRGITIGGEKPLICLPLMAVGRDELLRRAERLLALDPDILEWRIDGYPGIIGSQVAPLLAALRQVIGTLPLLFTCRAENEGGLQAMALERRLEIIESAVVSGNIDVVDLELGNGPEIIDRVRKQARGQGCSLLLSFHDFQATPDLEWLVAIFSAAQAAGADIAKVAVMPKTTGDVLTLLSACDQARQGLVDIPLVAISMGGLGLISRVAGGLFGSDITFAAGDEASAPGQLAIGEMRRLMAAFLGRSDG